MTLVFEDVLKSVGDYGRYQKTLLFGFLFPVSVLTPMIYLGTIFMNATPDHWCYVSEVASSNLSLADQRSLIRPSSDPRCTMYDIDYTQVISSGNWTPNESWSTKPCNNGWVYDKSEFDATAVSRWNMVCDDRRYSSLVVSLIFAGDVIGTPLFGYLSDKIGRKTIFFFLCALTAVTEVGSSLIPNFVTFLTFRAINGSIVTVLYISSYVTLLEIVGMDVRTHINGFGATAWATGLCLLPFLAWLTRHWIRLSLVNCTCALLLFCYWKLFQESPRWLLSKGRYNDAHKVLCDISKRNGKKTHESEELWKQIQKVGDHIQKEAEVNNTGSIKDILKYPRIRRTFLLVTTCWIGNSMPYFGLLVNVRNLGGNQFLNFFVLSALEFPSHLITWFLMERVGRRWTSVGAQCLTVTSCLLPALLPAEYLDTTGLIASLLGRIGSSSAFMTLYQQCPELYPTPLRTLGMSLSSTIGSASSLGVPFIADLAILGKPYPFLVFAAVGCCAGVCATFLPETLNRTLPQTMEDAEVFGKDDKFFSCARRKPESVASDLVNLPHAVPTRVSIWTKLQKVSDGTPKGLSFKTVSESSRNVYTIT